MITLTAPQIENITASLRGSTGSLEETINEELGIEIESISDIAGESLEAIDDEIFLCETCGWWCGTDERAPAEICDGDDICDECAGEDS